MAFEQIVEAIIREAMARGEFKNLPGKGKPVDLSTYFEAPEELRAAQALLKNAGIASREVELMNEVWELRRKAAVASEDESRQAIQRQIATRQLELDIRTEEYRRRTRGRR